MSSFKLGAAGDNQQVQVEQIQILEDRLEHLERICHGGHCHGEQGGSILLEEDLFSTVSRLHNQWLQMLQTQLPLADFIRKYEAIKPLLLLQELEEEESSSNAPPALDDTELLLLLDSISHLTHIASQLESLKQVLGISSNSTPTTTTPATASSAANMPLLDESTRLFTKSLTALTPTLTTLSTTLHSQLHSSSSTTTTGTPGLISLQTDLAHLMDTHNEHVTLLSQLFTWIHVELSRMERVVDREEARRRRDDGVDGLER